VVRVCVAVFSAVLGVSKLQLGGACNIYIGATTADE
jgi:hypothetical protein